MRTVEERGAGGWGTERRREGEGEVEEVGGREGLDYGGVAPPSGQDSCQPGPDMTSAEGEAATASQSAGCLRLTGGVGGRGPSGGRWPFRGEPSVSLMRLSLSSWRKSKKIKDQFASF